VYAVYDDTYAYFRADVLSGAPENSRIAIYVDNDGGGCANGDGFDDGGVTIYDKRIVATYSGGWTAAMDECSGGWSATGATVDFAESAIAEFRVAMADFGFKTVNDIFVKYGTTSDFAPDSGSGGDILFLPLIFKDATP
jgi:hypothetical protein